MSEVTAAQPEEDAASSIENDETEERLHALDHRALSTSLIKHVATMFGQAEQLTQNAINLSMQYGQESLKSAVLAGNKAIINTFGTAEEPTATANAS